MSYASEEILESLKQFDSPTIFNALVEHLGASQGGSELKDGPGQPETYTGPEILCLLSEPCPAVGYAVTCEVTTNDPDSEAIPWEDYYGVLEQMPVPVVTVMKDVDSRPGRGAAFGDNMAAIHKKLGVTGVIVDGSVRDVGGIREVGLPLWGRGIVAGHGVFHLVRVNVSITVGQLRVHPGELVFADAEGCATVPKQYDLQDILQVALAIQRREAEFKKRLAEPGFTVAKLQELKRVQ